MFGFFKKQQDAGLYAPVKGTMIPLSEVKDAVFSSGIMGEGVAFQLDADEICAPCNGQITMLADTRHAFGIQGDHGVEILIHVGMDTVNLNGEGLVTKVAPHAKVKKGDVIIVVDRQLIAGKGIDLTTPMVVTNGHAVKWNDTPKRVFAGDLIGTAE